LVPARLATASIAALSGSVIAGASAPDPAFVQPSHRRYRTRARESFCAPFAPRSQSKVAFSRQSRRKTAIGANPKRENARRGGNAVSSGLAFSRGPSQSGVLRPGGCVEQGARIPGAVMAGSGIQRPRRPLSAGARHNQPDGREATDAPAKADCRGVSDASR